MEYVNTSKQIADILTEGSFIGERWMQLAQLFIFDDTTFALSQTFLGVFICTQIRQGVEVPARTSHTKHHSQAKAGAKLIVS